MKLTRFFTLLAAATTVMFAACEQENGPEGTNGITLSAEKVVEINTPITFVVTDGNGRDVTSEATIFDKSNDFAQVSNPFTPTVDGDYTFYAVVGDDISKDIKVVVTPAIPDIPEDTDPANTSFKHRILLVDHTGTTCGYCPQMMLALKAVAETEGYHDKYYEAMAHSYASVDPAYSGSAVAISTYYKVNGYPTLTYNFAHPITSGYNAEHIKQQIDALWMESAEAGIAAATNIETKSAVVNVEVKAAVAGEYSVTAWLLEDGIEAEQLNGTEDWMDIHNNAIRQAAMTSPISGYELGTIEAGKSAQQAISLKLVRDDWNRDNLKVMVIASKKNSKGTYDVANVAVCNMGDSVTYDYNN